MAEFETEVLEFKLDLLETKADHLHKAVDGHVGQVMSMGKKWLADEGHRDMSYHELSELIDRSIVFVNRKCAEMSGKQLSAASSASSPPPFHAPVQSSQAAVTPEEISGLGRTTGSEMLKTVLARVDEIEVAVSSLRSLNEKVLSSNTNMQAKVDDMVTKQEQVNKELDDQIGLHRKIREHQAQRIYNLEQQVNKIAEENTKVQTEHETRLSEMESQAEEMFTFQSDMEKKYDEQLTDVSSQLEELFTSKAEMGKEISENLEEMKKYIRKTKDTTADMGAKLDSLTQKTGGFDSRLEETMKKIEDTRLEVSSNHEKDVEVMKEFEDKLASVRQKGRRDLKNVKKQFEDCNSKFTAVCQMVDERVLPLEKLRDIFNRCKARVEDRETVMGKYNDVLSELGSLAQKVSHLESAAQFQGIDFSARLHQNTRPTYGKITFTDVTYNQGNHYNPQTGEFTAPQDGLYFVCINIRQENDGNVDLGVCRRQVHPGPGRGRCSWVCLARTNADQDSSCGTGMVRMKQGDCCYVFVQNVKEQAELFFWSRFSCVLIK